MSRDPIGENVDTEEFNSFSFVNSNPINKIDLWGLIPALPDACCESSKPAGCGWFCYTLTSVPAGTGTSVWSTYGPFLRTWTFGSYNECYCDYKQTSVCTYSCSCANLRTGFIGTWSPTCTMEHSWGNPLNPPLPIPPPPLPPFPRPFQYPIRPPAPGTGDRRFTWRVPMGSTIAACGACPLPPLTWPPPAGPGCP